MEQQVLNIFIGGGVLLALLLGWSTWRQREALEATPKRHDPAPGEEAPIDDQAADDPLAERMVAMRASLRRMHHELDQEQRAADAIAQRLRQKRRSPER
ncbi:MAG: hypothetical protein Fur005_38430 [Roseiflexaceae bacterium]